jgi:hypothetical protein
MAELAETLAASNEQNPADSMQEKWPHAIVPGI